MILGGVHTVACLTEAVGTPVLGTSLVEEQSGHTRSGEGWPSPRRQKNVQGDDKRPLVLVVEDNRADVFLVQRAVEIHHLSVQLLVLDNGEEALDYFEHADADPNMSCPDVVLLDLNLPKKSGREVLQRVKAGGRCKDVPVIILTSSDAPEDRRETAALGARHYFKKPTSYQEFLKIGELLGEVLRED